MASGNNFKLSRLLAMVAILFSCVSSAFTVKPADGLWSIVSENNLDPGRAFVMETSAGITIITFYNYNSAGAPTFYVGGGPLSADNTVSVAFSEPTGGTSLGGAPRSGRLLSSPGTALFEFTSLTTGTVTLPGEIRKFISKGALAWKTGVTDLYGLWSFHFLDMITNATVDISTVLNRTGPSFTTDGGGTALNTDGTFGCEYQVKGLLKGVVYCFRKVGTPPVVDRSAVASQIGDEMQGQWFFPNSAGLPQTNVFVAKRMFGLSGDRLGLKRMSGASDHTTAAPPDAPLLLNINK